MGMENVLVSGDDGSSAEVGQLGEDNIFYATLNNHVTICLKQYSDSDGERLDFTAEEAFVLGEALLGWANQLLKERDAR